MSKPKIILLFILISNYILAQFDTSYVYITKNKFSTNGIFEFYNTSLKIKPNSDFNQNNAVDSIIDASQQLKSKNNIYVGFGLTFYHIGISLSFSLPYTNIPELKDLPSVSFTGGYSVKKFYAEVHYRNYKGFQEQIFSVQSDSVYEKYKIIKNLEYEYINGILYYFFSGQYNYDAAFKNYNIQKKSAYTPYVAVNAGYIGLDGSFDNVYSNNQKTDVYIDNYNINANLGIAGTFVFKKYYASVLGHIGLSVNKIYSNEKTPVIKPLPSLEVKSAIGYNSNFFFASFNFLYNNNIIYLEPNKIGVNNFYFAIKAGLKFNSKHLGKIGKYL